MISKDDRRTLWRRLEKVGLWKIFQSQVDILKDHLTQTSKDGTREVTSQAWTLLWIQFEPVCLFLERLWERQQDEELFFVGFQGDVDSIVDPEYAEQEAGMRLRHAFMWVADEFRRVVNDGPKGTRVDFTKAKTKPPTVFAVQVLEEYARHEPGSNKRSELFGKLQQFAPKARPKSGEGGDGTVGYEGVT